MSGTITQKSSPDGLSDSDIALLCDIGEFDANAADDARRGQIERLLAQGYVELDNASLKAGKYQLTGKAEGVTAGGELHQVFRKLPVRCRPGQIPVKLVHDVTSLGLDTVAHVKDLKLPEGVEVLLPPERTVAAVVTAKKRTSEEEDAAAATGTAAPEAAAGSKAPPAKTSEAPKGS